MYRFKMWFCVFGGIQSLILLPFSLFDCIPPKAQNDILKRFVRIRFQFIFSRLLMNIECKISTFCSYDINPNILSQCFCQNSVNFLSKVAPIKNYETDVWGLYP